VHVRIDEPRHQRLAFQIDLPCSLPALADVAEGRRPILGTSGNDRLTETSGVDVIEAFGGNDLD